MPAASSQCQRKCPHSPILSSPQSVSSRSRPCGAPDRVKVSACPAGARYRVAAMPRPQRCIVFTILGRNNSLSYASMLLLAETRWLVRMRAGRTIRRRRPCPLSHAYALKTSTPTPSHCPTDFRRVWIDLPDLHGREQLCHLQGGLPSVGVPMRQFMPGWPVPEWGRLLGYGCVQKHARALFLTDRMGPRHNIGTGAPFAHISQCGIPGTCPLSVAYLRLCGRKHYRPALHRTRAYHGGRTETRKPTAPAIYPSPPLAACNATCSTCADASSCDSCASGLVLTVQRSCEASCPQGQYSNSATTCAGVRGGFLSEW